MAQTPPSESQARSGSKGKRMMILYVGIAFVAVVLIAVLALVFAGGDQTGDGTGRSEITTTGVSDVVTAPGRSDR